MVRWMQAGGCERGRRHTFLCKEEIIINCVDCVMCHHPCTTPTSSIMASVSSTVIVAATLTASVSTIPIVVISFCCRDCCLYPSQL